MKTNNFLNRMMQVNSKLMVTSILISLIVLQFTFISCPIVTYDIYSLAYPKGTKRSNGDYEYLLIVRTDKTNDLLTGKLKRYMSISIKDKDDFILYKEEYPFSTKSPLTVMKVEAEWDKFEEIKLKILEHGNNTIDRQNEYKIKEGKELIVNDEYNKKLVKEGPNLLFEYDFNYDAINNIFIKH